MLKGEGIAGESSRVEASHGESITYVVFSIWILNKVKSEFFWKIIDCSNPKDQVS